MSILPWIQFCLAFIAGAAILYVPGYLILRLARLNSLESVLLSPLITLAVLGVEEIAFSLLRIPGSWLTLVLPVVALLLFLQIAIVVIRRHKGLELDERVLVLTNTKKNWLALVPYLVISLVAVSVFYVLPLDGANSYVQLYDSAWHLNIIQKFVTTGDFSTLHSGNIVDTLGSTFYPTGWHSLVALVVSMTHLPIPMSVNAVNSVIMVLVFPSSMYLLANKVFSSPRTTQFSSQTRRKLVFFAALTVCMFTAFPWYFLVFGPLYSNLLSFGALPELIVLGLLMVEAKISLKNRLISIGLWFVSLIGVGVTQPNAVFTMGVLVTPYLFAQLPQFIAAEGTEKRRKVTGVAAALLVAIGVVWIGLYKAPFMQRTVTWEWPAFESKSRALFDVAFLGFGRTAPIYLLGCLVAVGLIYTLFHREYLWMSVAYAIMCFMYWISSSSEGRLKNVLTGFWYHDQYRLAASTVFYGILLAALGINVCYTALTTAFKNAAFFNNNVTLQRSIMAVAALILIVGVFYPVNLTIQGQLVRTPFGTITELMDKWNNNRLSRPYTAQEEKFVSRAASMIEPNAVVLNQPYDGSAYAYALNGVNVYYKAWEGNWMGQRSVENELLSKHLNEIATNARVQQAVKKVGARYLLLLDRSDYRKMPDEPQGRANAYGWYNIDTWHGIEAVKDTTPGFEVVLKQGDMRLYRIQ